MPAVKHRVQCITAGTTAVGGPVVFHIWLCGNKTRAELEKEDKVRLTVNNPSAKVR